MSQPSFEAAMMMLIRVFSVLTFMMKDIFEVFFNNAEQKRSCYDMQMMSFVISFTCNL